MSSKVHIHRVQNLINSNLYRTKRSSDEEQKWNKRSLLILLGSSSIIFGREISALLYTYIIVCD